MNCLPESALNRRQIPQIGRFGNCQKIKGVFILNSFQRLQPKFDDFQGEIRKAKRVSGCTIQELSDRAGVPLDFVSSITSGSAKRPSLYYSAAVCDYFGLSLDNLLGLSYAADAHELELENAKLTEQIKHYKTFAAVSRTLVFALVGVCALLLCAVIGYVLFDMSLKTVGLFQSNGVALTAAFLAVIVLAAVVLIFYALRTVVSDIKGERNEMPEM